MADEKSGGEKGSDKGSSDNNLLVKAVAGVFGAVIAPVLVTFCVKYSDAIIGKPGEKPAAAKSETATAEPTKPAPEQPKAAAADPAKAAKDTTTTATDQQATDGNKAAGTPTTATGGTSASAEQPSAVADSEKPAGRGNAKKPKDEPPAFTAPRSVGPVVRLFNLTNFDGWYKYVDQTNKGDGPPGKNKDPDGVYKIDSGKIRISGQYWGALSTEAEYENYHLTVEFKWGKQTWGGQTKLARESGILLHATGPDGAHMGWAPQSVKCQIIEGGSGDLVCYNSRKSTTEVSFAVESELGAGGEGKARKNFLSYKPGAPLSTVTHGFVRRLGNKDDWKNVTGFHRDGDIEKPTGEWNTLECFCQGRKITVLLNGKLVNQAVNVTPTRGRISLQSHGAEIFFRKVELQQIVKN